MDRAIAISIHQAVGSPLCVAAHDGPNVFDRVRYALDAEKSIRLAIHCVTALTPTFPKAAISQL